MHPPHQDKVGRQKIKLKPPTWKIMLSLESRSDLRLSLCRMD